MTTYIKGELLEDCDWNINDYAYNKGQILDLIESEEWDRYLHYVNNSLDFIPKYLIRVIESKKP